MYSFMLGVLLSTLQGGEIADIPLKRDLIEVRELKRLPLIVENRRKDLPLPERYYNPFNLELIFVDGKIVMIPNYLYWTRRT